ncbi:MAG TPA: hypothetical protein P5077_08615 [bacterium]|nr:hypothetical protein [bacterium]
MPTFTADRLLRVASGLLLASFVVFALIVVARELARSRDPLNRLAAEQCVTLAAAGREAPPGAEFLPAVPASEQDLMKSGATCLFFDGAVRDNSPIATAVFERTPIAGWDHLFIGPRGALIIRDERDFAAEAAALHDCLRNGRCDAAPEHDPTLSLTVSLVKPSGQRPLTVSFYDETLGAIRAKLSGILREMASAKKLDTAGLTLETAFHRHYARVMEPDEKKISALAVAGRDGLMIASRGAKIRLLPWEYEKNPLRRLSTKGAQYGLEKEEYKKEVASVFIFSTVRYRETDGAMTPVDTTPKEEKDRDAVEQ